ncbi:hypothetical protein SAMN06272722_110153 [Paenibacillus sp. RU5A]|nr:hypothetical protein SAMN06272722_110153 [Paenibacillus sp. RU5A]SOC74362.1 hypothetical protein SAMN05880581_110153 [Paenibacillus sp. RU26A]SOC76483.1 hypothetical protein SAMN05880586_110153 [Paenibacillus sp. RU5M]
MGNRIRNFDIGNCDYCCENRRILKRHYDKYGDHILSECMHGCSNPMSEAKRLSKGLKFEVIELERLEITYIDSLWRVVCLDSNAKRFERKLVRLNVETSERLREIVEGCISYVELNALNLKINHD